MRRLFVNGRFLGGPETAVTAVARALTLALPEAAGPRGWRVTLAVPPSLRKRAEATGLEVRTHGRLAGIAWEQAELPSLRREGTVAGFFNTVPLAGRGYVTMLHDAHVFTTPDSFSPAVVAWRRLLSRRAGVPGNRLVTVSAHARDSLARMGICAAREIGVVPNGPGPAARTAPDARIVEQLGLGRSGAVCLAVGSLLPHKNLPVLLKAFGDPALRDVRLVLVGPLTRAEAAQAGHAVPGNVVFAGPVSDAELAALYRRAMAVCVPSLEEGFGLPALEGMALVAVPVVAPCGALPEVVGGAGLRAVPGDSAAWVAAVARLADDPALRRRLAAAGRARTAGFTWDAAAEAFMAHLDAWSAEAAALGGYVPGAVAGVAVE